MLALSKGIDVLTYLNEARTDSAQNIATRLGMSRPTACRILATLEDCGIVARERHSNIFKIARGARSLNSGLTDENWALWIAGLVIYELQDEILWPTDLATHENGEMVIRESTHSLSPYSIESRMVGSRFPLLNGSLGRAYISFCPDAEREEILFYMQKSASAKGRAFSVERVHRMIEHTRARGFGSRQPKKRIRSASIAVPVRFGGRVIACVDVIWIASAIEFESAVRMFLPPLIRAQKRIEHELSIRRNDERSEVAGSNSSSFPRIRRPWSAVRRLQETLASPVLEYH